MLAVVNISLTFEQIGWASIAVRTYPHAGSLFKNLSIRGALTTRLSQDAVEDKSVGCA